MYDKSKKTWSQRLKIHKNEKSQLSANSNISVTAGNANTLASSPTSSSSSTSGSPTAAQTDAQASYNDHIAHNVRLHSVIPASQYQITPAAIMHLPLSDYHANAMGAAYDYMSGRTMKYPESWIYGTVRGIPTRPASLYHHHPAYAAYAGHPHAAAIFATTEMPTATATAVAVVLCSCSEYLNSTKSRSMKKPSFCKKCKGTRLPLANYGGTVRVQGSIPTSKLRPAGASATVRVVSSTKKQRPTILDPQKDPYDLMRRTRLLSPESGGLVKANVGGGGGVGVVNSKEQTRNRGKSASPVRGRSRTRHHHQKALVNTTVDSSKALQNVDDAWLIEAEELVAQTPSTSHARKSILRCNVNPYDLISINAQNMATSSSAMVAIQNAASCSTPKTKQENSKKLLKKQKLNFSQNEFMPPNDDFNVQDAAFSEDERPFLKQNKSKAEPQKLEVHKKNAELPVITMRQSSKKPNYANVQAIAGQRISLGDEQQTPKSLLQPQNEGTTATTHATYESMSVESLNHKPKETENTNKAARPDTLPVRQAATPGEEPKRPPRANKQPNQTEMKEVQTSDDAENENELTLHVTVTPTYNIKSILKRPSSKNSESAETSAADQHSKPTTPSTPKQNDNDSKALIANNQMSPNTPSANSQFYIPFPQARKKVQFLVEENIEAETTSIDDSEADDSGNSGNEEISTNYEYYNRKRNQKKLQKPDDSENFLQSSDNEEFVTYDEQFIQAMLLEKLQLDSQLVTQQQQNNKTTLHIHEAAAENDATIKDTIKVDTNHGHGDSDAQFFKTDYEDVFTTTGNPNLTTRQQHDVGNASNITLDDDLNIKVMPIKQQQFYENPNSNIRQSATTKGSLEISTLNSTIHPVQTSAVATEYVTDMSGKDDDSNDNDGDLSNKDTNITALIDDGDNHSNYDDEDVVELNNEIGDNAVAKHSNVAHKGRGVSNGHDANACITSSSTYSNHDAATFGHTDDNNHADNEEVAAVNNGDDGNVIVSFSSPSLQAHHYVANKSAETTRATAIAEVVHDEVGDADTGEATTNTNASKRSVVKPKQQQQQQHDNMPKCNKKKTKKDMQTLAAPETTDSQRRSSAATGVETVHGSSGAAEKLTKETQSRNPIRRSQSERQPSSMTYLSNSTTNDSNTKDNNFKSDVGVDADDDDDVNHSGSNNDSKLRGNIKPNISNGLKDNPAIVANKINGSNNSSNRLHFQDTMALRKRSNRSDTRDLFTMALIGRPREPPPPPPAAISGATMLLLVNDTTPKAAHLEKATKVITAEAADAIESFQQTVNGLESKQQKATIGQEAASNDSMAVLSQEISDNTFNDVSDNDQQQMVQHKKATNINTTTPAQETNGRKSLATTKASVMTKVNNSSARGSKQPLQQQQQQRTVVRVAPFQQNVNAFEVHRLKITHTDNEYDSPLNSPSSPKTPSTPGSMHSSHYSVTDLSTLHTALDYGQKKTSILINGDDCYSTMNQSCDDSSMPHYQSSVVVTDGSSKDGMEAVKMTNTCNTVTINVSSPRSSEDELIQQHNQLNNLLKRQAKSNGSIGSIRAIIPIRGTIDINLQRSASSTSSTSTSSMTSTCSSTSSSTGCTAKRGKTLIRLDYDKEKYSNTELSSALVNEISAQDSEWLPHETELLKILRNPVEAVKRNLVPHICKLREDDTQKDSKRSKKMNEGLKEMPLDVKNSSALTAFTRSALNSKTFDTSSFIAKLLEDPMLNQVAEGLESDTVAELIENSLKRLHETRNSLDMNGTKDKDDMNRLIDLALKRIQEERHGGNKAIENSSTINNNATNNVSSTATDGHLLAVPPTKDDERLSNRGSISSANSFASAHNYELFDFDANESDCYQSCSSEINSMLDDDIGSAETKSKFYQMLVDATLQEIEISTNTEDLIADEHQYESIRHNIDPIYEEISDVPPPLPLTAPPLNDPELEKKSARSIFEGASKYDILSYLVDAKERGVVKEEVFDFPLNCSNPIIIEEESSDTLSDLGKLSKLKRLDTISSRSSIRSDSSDDNQSTISSLSPPNVNNFMLLRSKQASSDIERNDSGVGSETSKTSRHKYLHPSHNSSITSSFSSTTSSTHSPQKRSSPLHLCEDCDGAVETQIGENGLMFAPLVCRKCGKKRVERKEIITEIVETEEKYGRDLQIILEEFCHPMLVAGLLTQEQLSAIFLNTEELLENNQTLAERMRDGLDIALEQGDDDLLTVNIGKIFLESTQMLHAFESYCVRQAGASLLLANLEKDKELLRIFLKVSQMENVVLRRMNLNSFLMVPVQRVTKYPLLLARLYKVTPSHLEGRDQLKQAQEKIELHLNHINQEAKDVPTKLWRRISSSSPNRRASCEIDMINIKLRKMAIDVLEWNHDEVRFAMEGKLLYTQPTDSNWKKARTIKLTSVNALLVTNGKPSTNYKAEKVMSDKVNFPKHTGIREASLLMVKEKCGRYALIREPLYLDRCVVCSEADWDEYFEIQEISSKDTFIFKAEDNVRTKQWYTQLQYHAQGMGAWRKRRNALANIMINGMLTRS